MSNIIVIPNNKENINSILDTGSNILIGIEGYSINTLNLNIEDIKSLLNINTNIFISLNKNISNDKLDDVEKLLIDIEKMNIKGLFYSDVAIVSIVTRLNLNINLIWANEHLTTNYFTINYWSNYGVNGVFLSNEITKDEIAEIIDNTNSMVIVQLFGFIPMYASKRHAIKNYLNHFKIDLNSSRYYLFKENKKYPIIDNEDGTIIYTNFILNGLKEYLELKDKLDYVLINGYSIDDNNLLKVIDCFKKIDLENIDILDNEILNMFDNLDKGFLYEETIYRVKKNDK